MASATLVPMYELKPGIASCPLDGGSAVLDMAEGRYFMLNSVAARVWARLETRATIEDLVAAVEDSFETGAVDVEGDVRRLIAQFEERGFVQQCRD